MNKRTIDADELHKLTALLITSRDNEHIAWSNVLDAAFPLVEEPVTGRGLGLTPLPKSEAPAHWDYRFIRYAAGHDAVLVEYDGQGAFRWKVFSDSNLSSPGRWYKTPQEALEAAGLPLSVLGQAAASPTHNLRPLPESEWPENFSQTYYGKLCHDRHLVSNDDPEYGTYGTGFCVRDDENFPVSDDKDLFYFPTPAAALEAAGLPVELLEGLKQPTPAHENPRVVAAAVDMVKEIGQHKAKAAKDRADWLAPFPGWVREWCADDDKIVPLRYGDTWLLYADAGTVKWGRKDWFGLHYRDASPGKQFVGRLIDFAGDLNLPLYADGNVPLWGDVIDSVHDLYDLPPNPAAVIRIDGDTVFCGDGSSDSMSDLRLLRRHQAIADLPGIRNDSSAGKPDSNDSVGGVIVPPKPDKSTVVADNVGNSVGKPKVKLRVGILVEHEEMGRGVIAEPVTEIVNRVHVRFFDSGRVEWLPKSDLTPIPPPLIDNGDGTWTVDGYGMFRISFVTPENEYYWHSIEDVPWADGFTQSKELFPTKDAAALDLFERMEGVR